MSDTIEVTIPVNDNVCSTARKTVATALVGASPINALTTQDISTLTTVDFSVLTTDTVAALTTAQISTLQDTVNGLITAVDLLNTNNSNLGAMLHSAGITK